MTKAIYKPCSHCSSKLSVAKMLKWYTKKDSFVYVCPECLPLQTECYCHRCETVKPIEEFFIKRGRPYSYCRECNSNDCAGKSSAGKQSEETKAKISKSLSSRSEEDLAKTSKILSEKQSKYWASLSDEEIKARSQIARESRMGRLHSNDTKAKISKALKGNQNRKGK